MNQWASKDAEKAGEDLSKDFLPLNKCRSMQLFNTVLASRQNRSSAQTISLVAKVQLYHLGSSRQWDGHERGIDLSVVGDKWAEPVGLVGNRVVCEEYVFGGLVCERLTSSDFSIVKRLIK